MKLNELNPWVIVRWTAAAAVYVFTVLIAISEVNTKSRQLAEAEDRISEMEKSKKALIRGIDNLGRMNRDSMTDLGNMQEMMDKEDRRQKEESIEKLKGLIEGLKKFSQDHPGKDIGAGTK